MSSCTGSARDVDLPGRQAGPSSLALRSLAKPRPTPSSAVRQARRPCLPGAWNRPVSSTIYGSSLGSAMRYSRTSVPHSGELSLAWSYSGISKPQAFDRVEEKPVKCWSRLRLAFCLALSAMMVASAFAWQATSHPARRIYVEPLATQQGSEAFRTSLIAALKKLNTVSLASDEADADLILGGGGQIWIRGYRSHKP